MEIVKDIEIDIGHRIMQHESKCRHVHGHRLRFCIHATASKLDSVGRVVDFGVIKGVIGKWLNDTLDHVFVANPKDPIISFLKEQGLRYFTMCLPATWLVVNHLKKTTPRKDTDQWFNYVDNLYTSETTGLEPTSENIARMVFEQSVLLCRSHMKGVDITQIECFETPNSSATFTMEDMMEIWGKYVGEDRDPEGVQLPWYHGFLPPLET